MPSFAIDPSKVADYGALVIFFSVVLGLVVHWYFVRQPKEHKERRDDSRLLFEQVALSRQALETSNEVIRANTAAMERTADSHTRLGERMERVENVLGEVCSILGHNEPT